MKKIILLLVLLFSVITAGYSQASGYTFSQSTGNTYTEITGGTVVVTCTDCTDTYDSSSWVIALPAPVMFNGAMISSVVMRADGSLVMGSTETSSATGPLASATVAPGIISPLGMDLRTSTVAGTTYELRWEELAAEYVFQWKNAARWSQNATERLNFQVRINKTSGIVTMAYGSMTVANSTTYQPVVGLRGYTNTDFINRRLTSAIPDSSPSWDDTTAGTTNAHNVRFTTGSPAAFPALGLNFVWTPPTCFAPLSPAVTSLTFNSATVQYTAPVTVPSNGYEFYIATVNTAPDATATPVGTSATNSFIFAGLAPDTVHYYWIRGNCSGTPTNWVYGGTFRTDCTATTPPTALETFSGYSGSIPAACWREANGLLSATPISLAATTTGNWASGNFNNVTGGENGTAAYINLDGVDNEWIISPIFDLGDGSVDYQIEYTASVIPFATADTNPVTNMDEKFVKVVVSTDGGLTWSEANVVETYNNANIPAGGVNDIVNLAAYSGNVKIGFYGYSVSNDGVDLRFYIDNFRIIPVPSCFNPAAPEVSAVGETTATLTWTAATPAPANGYQYYISTSGTAPTAATTATGSVGAGILTANLTGLTPGTKHFVWVRSNCGASAFSEWIPADDFNTLCDAPDVLTTVAATLCGQGTATLSATVSNGTISWYNSQAGGTVLGTGASFVTPLVTETTSFWVGGSVQSATLSSSAKLAPNPTSTTFNTTGWGIVFEATGTAVLQSVSLYSTADGTVNIQVVNSAGVELYETGTVNITAGGTTTPNVIPLNYTVSPGTGYRIQIKAYTGVSLIRDSSGLSFPYNGSDNVINVTSAYNGGNTTGSYYWFYDLQYLAACSSPRTEVVVTVTPAPAIDATVSDSTICNGENTNLNVTSSNAGYTYVWMPGNLTGAAQTVSPAQTTTYTVTATDAVSGCVSTDEVVVTVNPLPDAITLTNSITGPLCTEQVATLTASGGTPNPVIGTGTATNTATGVPSPYSMYFGGNKYQMLIRASELNALGYTTGSQITAIAFNVASVGVDFGGTLNDFQIDMGHTAANVLNNTAFITGLTNYVPAANVNIPTTGLPANVTHTFITPFVWNGVDNIVVQTSFSNNVIGTTAQTVQMTYSPAGFAATSYYRDDEATAAFVLAEQDPASTTNNRPNMVFTATNPGVVWSPATNLYTNAAATTPYVAGTTASVVYVKSSTVGTTTYTATKSTPQGCSVTATIDITVNAAAAAPAASPFTFCNQSPTVANLTATGDNLQWYAAATGGTALANTTALATGNYYVSQTVNGCESARTAVAVTVNNPNIPTVTDLTLCNGATVANLTATGQNLQWYAAQTGGTPLADTTPLADDTTYYVSQTINGCESARTNVLVTINSTDAPTASDLTFCNEAPTVDNLTATGDTLQWYDVETGGTALAGTTAVVSGNYYVSQTVNGCESPRTEVAVAVNTTDAPATTNAVFCNETPTVADLAGNVTGTAPQWYSAETGDNPIASDAPLVDGTTYYVSQTINGCEGPRAGVTVTLNTAVADEIEDQVVCDSYVLPVLTNGNYFTATNGGGVQLTAGTEIITNSELFIFAQNGTCTAETSFNVTINTAGDITGDAIQEIEVQDLTDATIEDLVITATGTVIWYATEADALAGTNALAAGTQLENNEDYFAVQTMGDCTSAPFAVTVTVSLGREDFNMGNIKYYPNPVVDKLTVSFSSNITQVEVYNLLGQLVIAQQPNAAIAEVNMARLEAATYIVKVTAEGKSKTFKVVKTN